VRPRAAGAAVASGARDGTGDGDSGGVAIGTIAVVSAHGFAADAIVLCVSNYEDRLALYALLTYATLRK
jgi:hypothetical protein